VAIFGELSDLPFPEIFNMVGRRTGALLISGVSGLPPFQLLLADGALCALRFGAEAVNDPLQVRDKLAALMEAQSGTFEFQRRPAGSVTGRFRLPATSLLMAIASAVDEIGAYRDRFAHPRTRFKLLGGEEVWLDEDLRLFLERATPSLLEGADAEELARELDLSLSQIQLHLYKLRSVGKVAPVRAFEEEARPAAPVPAPRASPSVLQSPPDGRLPGTLARLLGSLRDRWSAVWAR
jgi:hypothetical protein